MERGEKQNKEVTEGVNEAPKFRWQVITEGGFHGTFGGKMRIYKPMEVFVATEEEVPLAFRDVIIKIGDEQKQKEVKEIPGVKPTFTLSESEEKGEEGEPLFFILNQNGKKLNSSPIPKDKAESFLKDLEE